ncbi:hypothetical protein [Thermocrispum agreste]|uniref:hypothetical protein n=1 Tax=Thermocrispum agreste TaxID=37925 RepID=UPI00041C9553|nr:hypothetical protein [Thermocrispum agreste]
MISAVARVAARVILAALVLIVPIGCLLAVFVLNMVAAFSDASPDTRHELALAAGVVMLVFWLAVSWTQLRAPGGDRRKRSRLARIVGWGLIYATWTTQVALASFTTFLFTVSVTTTDFRPAVAVAAGSYALLSVIMKFARWVAGFAVDWSFLRGRKLLRWLAGVATRVAIAGYGGLLVELVKVVGWDIPTGFHAFFRDWTGSGLLAVPCTAVAFVLYVLVVLACDTVLQHVAARLLGRDNAVGAWLAEHAPIHLENTDEKFVFEFRFFVRFRVHKQRHPWEIEEKYSRKYGPHARPLAAEEQAALVDRVADAVVPQLPPAWLSCRLVYRAVGSHEEVVVRASTLGPPDPFGDPVVEVADTELTGFPEVDALRRLRAAGYRPGRGAGFEWVLTFDAEGAGTWQADAEATRGEATWHRAPIGREPAWVRSPRRKDFRDDLRRYPLKRSLRPIWLWLRLAGIPASRSPASRRQVRQRTLQR